MELKEQHNMQTKEAEFIDHTLLAPVLIRESHNAMLDLMEQPAIYAQNHKNTCAFPSLNGFPERQDSSFRSGMQHFIQKLANRTLDEVENDVSSAMSASLKNSNGFNMMSSDVKRNYMYRTARRKSKCSGYRARSSTPSTESMEQYPPFTLTAKNENTADRLTSATYGQAARARALPHKKRLSHKLKIHVSPQKAVTPSPKKKQPPSTFLCELCDYSAASQLEFFAHLKEHYEPSTAGNILDSTKTNLDTNLSLAEKPKQPNNSFDDVFYDVQLDEEYDKISQSPATADLPKDLGNVNAIANTQSLIAEALATQATQLRPTTVDTIEFSDTEDMLEGIRSVVDKVSIEDTCDNIDLIETNKWFGSNNNFNDCEESFSGQLQEFLSNVDHSDCIQNDLKKESTPNQDSSSRNPIKQEDSLILPKPVKKVAKPPKTTKIVRDKSLSPSKKKRRRFKKTFQCSECNREYTSMQGLKYHELTHTGVKPHSCDVCGLSFYALSNLNAHKGTHSDRRPYQCDHCKRKFRQWGDLKLHMGSLHSDLKAYQCEFCGKAFARKYSLELHRRIHTSERNYKCDFCGKGFRASVYLQNHRKVHTGEKPHACDICGREFRQRGDLRRHRKIHERKATRSSKPKIVQPKIEKETETEVDLK